jgi:hypothetical protein
MEFERQRPSSADVPMSNDQVISFGFARQAMKNGSTGLLGLWIIGAIPLVLGIIFVSWILIGIGALVLIPTTVTAVRKRRDRKMWESPPQ